MDLLSVKVLNHFIQIYPDASMLMSGNDTTDGAAVNTIRLRLLWANISEVNNTLCAGIQTD